MRRPSVLPVKAWLVPGASGGTASTRPPASSAATGSLSGLALRSPTTTVGPSSSQVRSCSAAATRLALWCSSRWVLTTVKVGQPPVWRRRTMVATRGKEASGSLVPGLSGVVPYHRVSLLTRVRSPRRKATLHRSPQRRGERPDPVKP